MNKFLTHIFNEIKNGNRSPIYIIDAIFSLLSILLLPNKPISLIFSFGLFAIDFIYCYVIFSLNQNNYIVEKILTNKTKMIFFVALLNFGFFPLFIGTFVEKGNFRKILFKNTIPNVLGATIVYCLEKHLSAITYNHFAIKILENDFILNLFIKICYALCFFNSTKYLFDDNLKYANWINNIYLFIVIISGLLLAYALFYRIFIDNEDFDFSPNLENRYLNMPRYKQE